MKLACRLQAERGSALQPGWACRERSLQRLPSSRSARRGVVDRLRLGHLGVRYARRLGDSFLNACDRSADGILELISLGKVFFLGGDGVGGVVGGAQQSGAVCEDTLEQFDGVLCSVRRAMHGRQVVSRGQCVRVLSAQHSARIGDDCFDECPCLFQLSGFAVGSGDVVATAQSSWVVRAKYVRTVGGDRCEQRDSLICLPGRHVGAGEIVAASKSSGMSSAENSCAAGEDRFEKKARGVVEVTGRLMGVGKVVDGGQGPG